MCVCLCVFWLQGHLSNTEESAQQKGMDTKLRPLAEETLSFYNNTHYPTAFDSNTPPFSLCFFFSFIQFILQLNIRPENKFHLNTCGLCWQYLSL